MVYNEEWHPLYPAYYKQMELITFIASDSTFNKEMTWSNIMFPSATPLKEEFESLYPWLYQQQEKAKNPTGVLAVMLAIKALRSNNT